MNQYIKKCPVQILIVEDNENERIDCVDLLKRRFPGAHIYEAGSCDEAQDLICDAYNRGRPYDCAILDLKVPKIIGGIKSPNTEVGQAILDKFGPAATRLIQWTAHPDDHAIDSFKEAYSIASSGLSKSGIIYEVIPKDVSWPKRMVEFIDRLIAEKAVGKWLDDPYFTRMRDRSVAVIAHRPLAGRTPVDIPAYVQALMGVWSILEPHRRLEALATFKGTEWQLAESEGEVKLTNPCTEQIMEDARENARTLAEVMRADTHRD
jgi:hypothetical protein